MKHNKRNDTVTHDLNPIWPKVSRFQWWVNRDGYEVLDEPGERESEIRRKQLGKFGWRLTYHSGDFIGLGLEHYEEYEQGSDSGASEEYPLYSILVARNFDYRKDLIDGDGRPTGCLDLNVEDYPGLYRDFASMPRTRKGVLDFASRYGFLGINMLGFYKDKEFYAGEWIADWIAESYKMNLLLQIWEELQLGEFYSRIDSPRLAYYDTGLAFIHLDFNILEQCRSGDLYEEFELPVRQVERESKENDQGSETDWISDYNEHMSQVFETTLHSHLMLAIELSCYPDFEFKKGAHIRLMPRGLLGAMYLQFLNEVIGMPDPINCCPVCGLHFKAQNSSKKFCSDKCKMKAYRRSKKEKVNGR